MPAAPEISPRPRPGWLATLVDAVFPPVCALCGALDGGDGFGCAEHRPLCVLAPPRCGRCAVALPSALPDGSRCRRCRERAPAFQRVIALSEYGRDARLREWILAFKHGGRADLDRLLGGALALRWIEREPDVDRDALLVPVPLHAKRRFERGYDQAWLLASVLAEKRGLRALRLLTRTRATAPQGAPLAPTRTANVHDAFALTWRAEKRLEGRTVWLVDDVVTSGATVNECARVLRGGGAASVSVLALARADPTRREELALTEEVALEDEPSAEETRAPP